MDEERYWRAVLDRDPRYDGHFVYAVSSTMIYCRPSCPSRRPQPEQVRYFPAPEAAERAGYRPCKRCHPGDSPDLKLLERACVRIEESLESPVTTEALAAELGITVQRLGRIFKKQLAVTPKQYADVRRITAFKSSVRNGQPVTRSLYDCGYGSSSRLYERAGRQLGMTPAAYRRGGTGMRIGYCTAESPLGRVLVGATERGVCAVCLGSSDAELEHALRSEYPRAVLHRDEGELELWTAEVLERIGGAPPSRELPLDITTTAFRLRVWEELRKIPAGETRTYSQIARAVGQPEACRAVANACAHNPVAVVIPCHRVVPATGAPGGYRWGAERKRKLLELEAACLPVA